jgi:hypothetical protein
MDDEDDEHRHKEGGRSTGGGGGVHKMDSPSQAPRCASSAAGGARLQPSRASPAPAAVARGVVQGMLASGCASASGMVYQCKGCGSVCVLCSCRVSLPAAPPDSSCSPQDADFDSPPLPALSAVAPSPPGGGAACISMTRCRSRRASNHQMSWGPRAPLMCQLLRAVIIMIPNVATRCITPCAASARPPVSRAPSPCPL